MSSYARIGMGLLLLGLCGCQATSVPPDQEKFFRNDIDKKSGWHHLGMYAKDVGLDLLDIVTVDVGLGKSGPFGPYVGNAWIMPFWLPMFANAHATKYAEAGFGSWTGYKVGWLGRGMGVWREERTEGGFTVGPVANYSVHAARVPVYGTPWLHDKYLDAHGYNIDLDQNGHWLDFGASLHVIALGADVNVSPFEFADFVFGFFGNFPNPAWVTSRQMPWDIGVDVADDDTRVSLYDDKIGRYRANAYSVWPTIWPTTFGQHEQIEGAEWAQKPSHSHETGSVGGAFGGTHGKPHRTGR